MTLPLTLSRYIGRQFLLTIGYTALALSAVALVVDAVELIRRTSGKAIPVGAVLEMALLKNPGGLEKLLPFAVLVGGLLALSRLTRSQELVVARAAGVSVWQILAPAVIVVFAMGIISATVFNPLASVMLLKYEKMEGKYITGRPSLLAVSESGLWLRQIEGEGAATGEHIIYAQRLLQGDMSLTGVIVFAFDAAGRFTERLDADSARLEKGALRLNGVIRSRAGKPPERFARVALPTRLELEHIQDSFATPETIPFWKLPSFIRVLEEAGFSALRHRIYWQSRLASPFLYAGMVLLAALFALRLPRLGRVSQLIVAGLASGFGLHFFTNIVHALGMAGTLPVALAAWAPAGIILMLSSATLLHLEDG